MLGAGVSHPSTLGKAGSVAQTSHATRGCGPNRVTQNNEGCMGFYIFLLPVSKLINSISQPRIDTDSI